MRFGKFWGWRNWASGIGFRLSGSGLWVPEFGFRVPGIEYRVSVFGFLVSVSGFCPPASVFQILGSGYRASNFAGIHSGSGYQFSGIEFRVPGFGMRVSGTDLVEDLALLARRKLRQQRLDLLETLFGVGAFKALKSGSGTSFYPQCPEPKNRFGYDRQAGVLALGYMDYIEQVAERF